MHIRNYSPRTIKSYVSMLACIAKFHNQSPDQLSSEQIKSYLYHIKEIKGYSVATINQTISALKILFKDVCGLKWDKDIMIKRPRGNRFLPDILSQEEILKMIRITVNVKHKAILTVLYSSGLRREELLNLRLSDIDSNRMVIRVRHGKGNKSRDAILSPNALKILREYYAHTWPKPKEYLFESYKPGIQYSASSVLKIVKRAAKKASVTKRVYIHSLRHAFATHLLEHGTNLKVIQMLLGHTSLRSTAIYLHLAKIDPNTVVSPFDQL